MKFQITTKDMELTDGLREYIKKRLSGLERYSNHIMDGEIIFEELRGRYRIEVILRVKGATLTAVGQSKDPREAVDRVKDKIKVQLTKYEEKLKSFR
jgi:putative sigma-54 modulation protein